MSIEVPHTLLKRVPGVRSIIIIIYIYIYITVYS